MKNEFLAGSLSQLVLTEPLVVLHAEDGVLVSPVVQGTVPKLGHPALDGPVRGAAVDQPVADCQAKYGAPVSFHGLNEISFN